MRKNKNKKSINSADNSTKNRPMKRFQEGATTESLQQIANCLGFIAIHMDESKAKTDKEKIGMLFYLGFDRNQIAAILGKDPDTVSVSLSQMGLTARTKS